MLFDVHYLEPTSSRGNLFSKPSELSLHDSISSFIGVKYHVGLSALSLFALPLELSLLLFNIILKAHGIGCKIFFYVASIKIKRFSPAFELSTLDRNMFEVVTFFLPSSHPFFVRCLVELWGIFK